MDEENMGSATEQQEDNSLETFKQKFEDQRKRAEKAEAEAKEIREALNSIVQEEQEQVEKQLPTQENGFSFDRLADNLAILKPLEQDEVEELRTQAKELGVDPIKFAQSPAWKAQLEKLKVKRETENDTPEPSHRTAIFEGKTFADIIHDPKASDDSKQKAFEAQRNALLKRGSNQNM